MILYNIGSDEITVGALTLRGYYLGSNIFYNVKKMTEHGFLELERSAHDRRSVRVKLSKKGLKLSRHLENMSDRHVEQISDGVEEGALSIANDDLRNIERLWLQQLGFGPRISEFSRLSVA